MTNDMQNINNTNQHSANFGAYLQTRRESMGLDRKDAAAQLRLSERVIEILETEKYPADLPVTFIRGYLRAYSKLLQIPDHDLHAALEPIQPPKPVQNDKPSAGMKDTIKLTSTNYYMQFSTYVIAATVATLVGMWWYNHTPSPTAGHTETQALALAGQNTTNSTNMPEDTAKPPMLAAPNSLNAMSKQPETQAGNITNTAKPAVTASAQTQTPSAEAPLPPAATKSADRPSYAANQHASYDDEDANEEHSADGSSD